MAQRRIRSLVVAGATATGKTALGEWLAERLGATIVCADSRQVFHELNIGTGKPTAAELAALPHVLFDALSLAQRPSAGWYAEAAAAAVRAIDAADGTALFVGGSGLYLRAVLNGLSAEPPRDAALRHRLMGEAAEQGPRVLHERLSRLDPARAAQLAPADTQRILRALEIVESSGHTSAWWRAQPASPRLDADWTVVEVILPGEALSERIEQRTRMMFDSGLVEETRELVAAGHEAALSRLRAVGYDEALELLQGRLTREQAEANTSLRTRQLAKRQRTWFRNQLEALRIPVAGREIASIGEEILGAFGG